MEKKHVNPTPGALLLKWAAEKRTAENFAKPRGYAEQCLYETALPILEREAKKSAERWKIVLPPLDEKE